ncbi:dynamin family protein [Rhodobacter sp. NSM]|uniref:dynamin family protein n=1 Tax=Rhodobacter sp. NSM TaxID=3457501 RepID=UPI003FD55D6C
MSFQHPLPRLDPAPGRPSAGRRLRVVVAGEFKSGKSSVINALLRRPVLPMLSRQASRPAFLVRHVADHAGTVLLHHGNGQTEHAETLDDATNFGGAGLCEVLVNAPHLDGVELVELPFPCDGEVGSEALALMAGADLLIWVSIASQAWRLSEKAILSRLPSMRARSVIVLSRADKLRSAEDWDRIEERVQREAGPFFSAVAFVQASRETIRAAAIDDHAWETSGGHILADLVSERRQRMASEASSQPAPRTVSTTPREAAPRPRREAETGRQSEIDQVASSLAGLVCGGILRVDDGSLLCFGPERDRAEAIAPAVHALLPAQDALETATGTPVEECRLHLGPHLLLVTRPTPSDIAFLLLRQDRTNMILAQTALRRIISACSGEN